ncbi:TerB family tellurite resistance protein [Dyadobacter psychrotolerans]|uniref:TerB family tellurite resistance protein n=2 Tax=Dyadobacter psychrotolerans TaxID=2541721 RepID=A0A4R5DGB2_9BACT|nr:TerB family tellurite resistance protein [Dyadobacter psychrotolerans]
MLLMITALSPSCHAQTAEVQQLILNIEKLNELRKILSELKAGYEILFKGYNTIKNISEGNFKLHQTFLNSLLKVSPQIKNYKRVGDIIRCQIELVQACQKASAGFSKNENFSKKELAYIDKVYSSLLSESLDNLDALSQVLTDDVLRASDDQRLSAIDNLYEQISDKLTFVRYFNSNAALLASQRANQTNDARILDALITPKP